MQLHFKIYGHQGPRLIILHGLLGSLDNWQSLAKKYAEYFTVYTIDQRNHGKSPHSAQFDYDILSDDLFDFMYEHNLASAHILGHSMGGKTAMYFAMKYPEKVDKLIVADIAPVKYKEGHKEIFDALFSVDLSHIENRKEIDEQLKVKIPQFAVRQFLMKGLTRNDERKLSWKFNLIDLWNCYPHILDIFERENTYHAKTLFVKGERSNYILDEYQEDIKHFFPQAQTVRISNAGHWLHAENPKMFLEKTLQFLNNQ